jgi:Zn-dependent protease with chaperone function
MTGLRLTCGLAILWGLCGVAAADDERQPVDARRAGSRVSFTPQERKLIDEGALWSSREKRNKAQIEAYGSIVEWLVSRTPLPAEDEQRQALAKHREVLKAFESSEPPAAAKQVLRKLADNLPARMRPAAYRFTLTVVEDAEQDAFTVGAGHVYVARTYLQSLLSDKRSGIDQLAFVIAHELGHICRRHVRRQYQRQWLQQELVKDVDRRERSKRKKVTKSALKGVAAILEYVDTREEDFQADLFAIHLCRNAGYDLENCLDALRSAAVKQNSALLQARPPRQGTPPIQPEIQPWTTGESLTLASHPSAVHRLRRLRLELDGLVYGDAYGLFEFDRETGTLKRAADNTIEKNSRAVICIHGMESDLRIYQALMQKLAAQQSVPKLRVLGFQYPSDESLSRVAKYFEHEMQRVCRSANEVDFVCHSAGGLVFRHYAEVDRGEFRRAIFQGTPHGGSDLARLRPLLEVKQFFGDLKLGLDPALERAIIDGQGQITFDLQPDSLFLRYLNRPRSNLSRDRYVIYRGRALKSSRALLLRSAVALARGSAKRSLEKQLSKNTPLARFAAAGIDKLKLPQEVLSGDLAVTLENAMLDDVDEIHTYPLKHTQLPRNAEVIEHVIALLIDEQRP